jgi:hypothetical protein
VNCLSRPPAPELQAALLLFAALLLLLRLLALCWLVQHTPQLPASGSLLHTV